MYFFSSSEESAGVSYTQDDVSFAVKQLLMKYLPSDHLAKLASKNSFALQGLKITVQRKMLVCIDIQNVVGKEWCGVIVTSSYFSII